MFLATSAKRKIPDSTLSSQHQQPSSSSNSSETPPKRPSTVRCHSLPLLAEQNTIDTDSKPRLSTLIVESSTLLVRIISESLTYLGRWLHGTYRLLREALNLLSGFNDLPRLTSTSIASSSSSSSSITNLGGNFYSDFSSAVTEAWSWSSKVEAASQFLADSIDANASRPEPEQLCLMDLCRGRVMQRAVSQTSGGQNKDENNGNGSTRNMNTHHHFVFPTGWPRYDVYPAPDACHSLSAGARGAAWLPLRLGQETSEPEQQQQTPLLGFQGQHNCGGEGFQPAFGALATADRELGQFPQHAHGNGRHQQIDPLRLEYLSGECEPQACSTQASGQQQEAHYRAMNFSNDRRREQRREITNDFCNGESRPPATESCATRRTDSLVLVSKQVLNDLTSQIAASMSKMKDLEEQVRVIPELQRRLDHVMSDTSSVKSFTDFNRNSFHSRASINDNLLSSSSRMSNQANARRYSSSSNTEDFVRAFNPSLQRHYSSIRNSPIKQKEHYKPTNGITNNSSITQSPLASNSRNQAESGGYKFGNSLSRLEQKNSTNGSCGIYQNSPKVEYDELINDLISLSYSVNCPSSTPNKQCLQGQEKKLVTPSKPAPISSRSDASTSTELSMDDIVTRNELNTLIVSMRKNHSTVSSFNSSRSENCQLADNEKVLDNRFASFTIESGDSSSCSGSGPKSSSPLDSRSDDSCDYGQNQIRARIRSGSKSECSSNKGIVDETEGRRSNPSEEEDVELGAEVEVGNKKEEEEDGTDTCSMDGDEPYSLGSDFEDPSDFEEYCAYGDSLDRRTKDFMSQSTKIPNDLRFALIRLNDFIRRKRPSDQIASSSGCIEVIRKEWFEVAASKDSQAAKAQLYVDYFESFTKQLLNMVVNLTDSAGNTAMHYAASHFKLDIVEVLLNTKICDVNRRNKAGYTPIMLLALAELETPKAKEVSRLLFTIGDVNMTARSSGQTALMLAASHGRLATCKLLLECGADPSLQDLDGSTALMCGSELGNEEIVRCLLAHKLTDPTATDNDGLDALTIAMNNGHKNIGLILYAAKNVPRMMVRSSGNINGNNLSFPLINHSNNYLGASLRKSRAKPAMNFVKRADSLLGSRNGRPTIRGN